MRVCKDVIRAFPANFETQFTSHPHNSLHAHHNSRYESHHQPDPLRVELLKAALFPITTGKMWGIKQFKLQPICIEKLNLFFYTNVYSICWEQSSKNIFTLKHLVSVLLPFFSLYKSRISCISIIIMPLFWEVHSSLNLLQQDQLATPLSCTQTTSVTGNLITFCIW